MTYREGVPLIEWFSLADLTAAAGSRASDCDVSASPENGAAPAGVALAQCRARLRDIGFGTLAYGAFDMIGRQMLSAHLLREGAPVSLMQSYLEGRLYDADPRFERARRSGLPVVWQLDDIDAAARRGGNRPLLALAAQLRAQALHSGVMFGVAAPRVDLHVVVSVGAETHGAGWIDDRAIGGALAASLAVHQAALPWLEARVARMRRVTLDREQHAVLERLVHGASDQEIADALRTSLHKVGAQVRSLERRFNARNRAQLAYLAARRLRH